MLLFVLAGCGGEDPPPVVSGEPQTPPLPVAPLAEILARRVEAPPDGPATSAECIELGIRLLMEGDLQQVEWGSETLGRHGEAAAAALAARLSEELRKNPEFARNAIQTFAERLPAPDQVEAIAAVLESKVDPSLYRVAARALGATGNPAAAAPLAKLAGSEEMNDAAEAVAALARLGEPGARALREVFPDGVFSTARAAAVRTIGRGLPREEAIPFLLENLDPEIQADVVVAAAVGLLERGDERGRELLLDLLEKGIPRGLELAALEGLAEAGDRAAPEYLLRIAAEPIGNAALPAVELLGRYPGEDVWTLLRRLSGQYDESDMDRAAEALYQLHVSGAPDARERILGLLDSEKRLDRILAALVLARIETDWSVAAVAEAVVGDPDPGARMKLLHALAILGRPEGAEAAVAVLANEAHASPAGAADAFNAGAALRAMPALPDAVLDRLADLAKSGKPAVRIHAAGVLGVHGESAEHRDAVASLFASEYPDVRMAGAWAWITMPEADPAPLVDMAARDPSRLRSRRLLELAEMARCEAARPR